MDKKWIGIGGLVIGVLLLLPILWVYIQISSLTSEELISYVDSYLGTLQFFVSLGAWSFFALIPLSLLYLSWLKKRLAYAAIFISITMNLIPGIVLRWSLEPINITFIFWHALLIGSLYFAYQYHSSKNQKGIGKKQTDDRKKIGISFLILGVLLVIINLVDYITIILPGKSIGIPDWVSDTSFFIIIPLSLLYLAILERKYRIPIVILSLLIFLVSFILIFLRFDIFSRLLDWWIISLIGSICLVIRQNK